MFRRHMKMRKGMKWYRRTWSAFDIKQRLLILRIKKRWSRTSGKEERINLKYKFLLKTRIKQAIR